jgi:hypothetical protein
VPGVTAAETWRFATTQLIRPDGSESRSFITFGLPTDTTMVKPKLQEGRWLLPADGNGLVATANVREDEPDLRVGDTVMLRVNGRDAAWTLVGIVESPTRRPFLYTNAGPLEEATREVGRASVVLVRTEARDQATQDRVGKAVADHLETVGVRVAATTTIAEVRTTQERLFDVLVIFLSMMALLLGVVGGIGLTGTMSINVVERAREIGVIRAVGASDGAVLRLFLAEGVLIGLISWALGALLAIPISRTLSNALGMVFLARPLSYAISAEGVILWLGVVLVLAAVASLLPAWRASRLAVREVLAWRYQRSYRSPAIALAWPATRESHAARCHRRLALVPSSAAGSAAARVAGRRHPQPSIGLLHLDGDRRRRPVVPSTTRSSQSWPSGAEGDAVTSGQKLVTDDTAAAAEEAGEAPSRRAGRRQPGPGAGRPGGRPVKGGRRGDRLARAVRDRAQAVRDGSRRVERAGGGRRWTKPRLRGPGNERAASASRARPRDRGPGQVARGGAPPTPPPRRLVAASRGRSPRWTCDR